MTDILYNSGDFIFSYRVAGICVQNGKVLLQKTAEDDGFAFPGGHAAFGETNEETLIREFKEETGANISVGGLKWVAEIFFPWGDKSCHQICLYYMVTINSAEIQKEGTFTAYEHIEGRAFDVEFHWIPLENVKNIPVYPSDAAELLFSLDGDVRHFVYREKGYG